MFGATTSLDRAATSCAGPRCSAAPRPCAFAAPRLAAARAAPLGSALPSRRSRSLRTAAAAVAGQVELPADYAWYETLIVMRPDLTDEARDQELAKFEAFLAAQGAKEVTVTVRGKQRLAYPIKRFPEGIYVLYTYGAGAPVSQNVQRMLSTPEAGKEDTILRHMSFRV